MIGNRRQLFFLFFFFFIFSFFKSTSIDNYFCSKKVTLLSIVDNFHWYLQLELMCVLLLMCTEKFQLAHGSLWNRAGKPLEMTVAFADIGKGNITMKKIYVGGIIAVIIADTREKEMWEINDICPEVCMRAQALNRRLRRKSGWMRIAFIKYVLKILVFQNISSNKATYPQFK